jgi:hypothetical protein
MPSTNHTALFVSIAPDKTTAARSDSAKLKEVDAVEIWIARWLKVPPRTLIQRYGCNSRRLYEIWWGQRFPASRAKAEAEFRARYPGLVDRTSYGYRRIPRAVSQDEQMALFE